MSRRTNHGRGKRSSIPGWLKAGGTSVFGLISGAVLMYLTPLVNSAIKPAEPVANFGFQAQGLAVTFQNRSTNATDGWWDFGDGSALEPFSPQQSTIAHTYATPDSYLVKLSLTNVFNEKSDRTVTVKLDNVGAAAPVIEQFQVAPLSPGMPAPAVFHLVAKVKNADQLIWCYGDTKPIEVSIETGGSLERDVTIEEPGNHTFRVVAVGGKQWVEKISSPVHVSPAPSGNAPIATVMVSYDAVHVDRQDNVPATVRLPWKLNCQDNLCPVVVEWLPKPGYQVVKAELNGDAKDARVRGTPRIDIAPDRSKLTVSADLVRPANVFQNLIPMHHVHLHVTLEKHRRPRPRRGRCR